MQKVREMKDEEGFNALTDMYENLVKAGVIDPARSCARRSRTRRLSRRCLTTEALICDIPEAKKDAPMPGGGGMGGMY